MPTNEFQHIRIEEVGDATVVRFCDERYIDSEQIEELGRELYSLVEGGKRRKVVLDFKSIELFSSAAFGKLISLNGRLRANSGALKVCNVPEHTLEVFRICKLDRIFDIRKDEADALIAFSA